jgi:VWFA-related protein
MHDHLIRLLALFAAVLCVALAPAARAQQPTPTPPPSQQDEVIRIESALMQTDVTVVDKGGALVDGLKREQFELRVDKKPRQIQFFEQVKAGSANEEAQLAAARGGASTPTVSKGAPVPLDRGRTVFFYVDDSHLSPGSMHFVRKMLFKFLDSEMGQNDEAAIMSPSGRIGFLQQLTENKQVLRLAAERLRGRPSGVRDIERPPMSEYQALQVETDRDLLAYYVEQVMRQIPGISRNAAEEMVLGRAHQLRAEAGRITANTLQSLEGLIASSKELPGRKLIVFISDGFFLDYNADSYDRLRRATAAANRAGVVIYTIDARGLIASLIDASSDFAPDPSGRLDRAMMGEIMASQDGLNALARDTGGRPLFNTNDLSFGVTRALKETSAYYLIAWRPEEEDRRGKSARVEISIVGRPDLTVRLRHSFASEDKPPPTAKNKSKTALPPVKQADEELRTAVTSVYTTNKIPTSLIVEFLDDLTTGSKTVVAMQSALDASSFKLCEGKPTAEVGLLGVVYDVEGKVAGSFHTQMTVKPTSTDPQAALPESVSYLYQFKLKPGIYQVRVAARDNATGRTGSARQWIEVPDLASGKLVLGSLMLGERTAAAARVVNQANPLGQADLNVQHRFSRSSNLRFLTFVYNATRRNGGPTPARPITDVSASSASTGATDLAVQVHLLRDNQPVVTTTSRRIGVFPATDLARIPYAADIPLFDLLPGRYVLQVTVIDRIAKSSATQRTSFVID